MRTPFALRFALSSTFAVVAAAITGCGIGPVVTSGSGDLQIRGNIFGGQQPVSHASVQLYAAGMTGNGSGASSELLQPVMSDDNGNFTLTGQYTCHSLEDQVYLVATGGNPGLAAGTNNAAGPGECAGALRRSVDDAVCEPE